MRRIFFEDKSHTKLTLHPSVHFASRGSETVTTMPISLLVPDVSHTLMDTYGVP